MKKALVICYDFPPLPSVAAQRPFSWANNFYDNGIVPIVITRKWKKGITNVSSYFKKDIGENIVEEGLKIKVIRACYKGSVKANMLNSTNFFVNFLRKTITTFEHVLKWKINAFDDTYFLYENARAYLLENKVDFILVSGQPFSLFKYAYKLNKEFNIPYVLDYRDGWTTDHAVKGALMKMISFQEKKLEEKYLDQASFFIAASDKIIADNIKIFPKTKGFLHENGIDLELLNKLKLEKIKEENCFTITFAGSLYDTHSVDLFIEGMKKFINDFKPSKFRIKFIGIKLKPSANVSLVEAFQIKYPNIVEIVDAVSHADSIRYQLSSSLLLKFDYTGQHEGLLGAKLYEYAATKKPILTVLSIENKETTFYPDKNVQYMVNNLTEIVDVVSSLYQKYEKGEVIDTGLTDDEIYSFSREKKVEELVQLINSNI